jgi:hypothetical protein
MPSPMMEDAVTDFSSTVFKRYARRYCSNVPLSGTCEAVVMQDAPLSGVAGAAA